MQINVNELISGCILTKDVEGKTSRPIIPKDTVIYRTHIEVLQAFRVKEVHISSKMANGENVEDAAKEYEQEHVEVRLDDDFREQYLDGVYRHQQMFKRWRNGFGIDLPTIREWFLPLLFKATATKQEILRLHHYTREAEYMHHHSVSMGLIAGYLGQRLGLHQGEWIQVALGGLLSDSGMSALRWDTLHKTGALTEEELKEIYQHPVYSYRMVEDLTAMNKKVKLAVLQHHERLDGSGYPLGVRQDKIQFYSQIIAVSDVYHAMTSERPYRKKQSPFKVIEEIQKEQFGKYDLRVANVLTNDLTNISIGTTVKLSNDEIADIVFIDSAMPTHPMVRLHSGDVLISLKDEGLYVKEVY